MNGGRRRKHVGAVAGQCDEGLVGSGQFHADRRAAVPPQRAAAAREHRAGLFARHVIASRREIGDAFIEHDRIRPDLAAHACRQIFRRDGFSARRFEAGKLGSPLAMPLGVVTTPALGGWLVDLRGSRKAFSCARRGRGVGAITAPRLDVPKRHRLLQRIDIDDSDCGLIAGFADRRNPRHVAVDHQNKIGLRQRAVLDGMVPLIALIKRIVMGIVDGSGHGFQHPHAEPVAEADEFRHGGGISAQIGRDDERPDRFLNGLDKIRDGRFGERRGRYGRPVLNVDRNASEPPPPSLRGRRRYRPVPWGRCGRFAATDARSA